MPGPKVTGQREAALHAHHKMGIRNGHKKSAYGAVAPLVSQVPTPGRRICGDERRLLQAQRLVNSQRQSSYISSQTRLRLGLDTRR